MFLTNVLHYVTIFLLFNSRHLLMHATCFSNNNFLPQKFIPLFIVALPMEYTQTMPTKPNHEELVE
uniref:Uncharacterized protein n=1 Tax=Rhizophora mucronata TaxID=61149 RepID=A0A2P2NQL1_RHIMU